jgi:anti-anti-sigma factor
MIMKARQDGNVIVFELEGQLDFETTLKFQETCENILKTNEGSRIIFNMERLKFVGSSGINHFIRIMKDFNSIPNRPKIVKVSSEFSKILKAYQTARHPFEIYEDELQAIQAFDAPPPPAPVKKPKKKLISN